MTVSTNKATTQPLPGDGVNKEFDFDFTTYKEGELAYWVTEDEIATEVTTDFSVVLNVNQTDDPGGIVTYPVVADALTALQALTIKRSMPFTQETLDVASGQPLAAPIVMQTDDRAAMERQQLKEELGRTIKVDPGTEVPDDYLGETQEAAAAGAASAAAALASEEAADLSEAAALASEEAAALSEAEVAAVAGGFTTDHFDAVVDFIAGTTDELPLSIAPLSGTSALVTFDGVVQDSDTWEVIGTDIFFDTPIPLGTSVVEVNIFPPVAIGVPGDETVTTDKLVDEAVTTDKILNEAVTTEKTDFEYDPGLNYLVGARTFVLGDEYRCYIPNGPDNLPVVNPVGDLTETWVKLGQTKTGFITRDASLASGSVAYTGVGFKPHSISVVGGDIYNSTTKGFSDGLIDGCVFTRVGDVRETRASLLHVSNGTLEISATLATFDADGFTLAWVRTNAPVGTALFYYTVYS